MAIWEIKERKYENIIDQLLFNRGIDLEEKENFISPDFGRDLFDPFLMKGIKEAAARIALAKEKGETVGIFSDYDADGIPGAALFYRALTRLGIKSFVYIPNRESGYGLSKAGIDFLIAKKCSLIITIDLGIRNFEEALYCKEKKVDLIITDHHLPDEELPKSDILINPKIPGDKYPFKELCGCGVAYKLIQALGKTFPKEIDEAFLKWHLDLVAISTISDVVPVISENRVLAKYGLMVLQKTKNIGLQELYKVGVIDPSKINSYTTGFQIAPRINAPGRIDHATKSFELLVTEDKEEAHNLALWLEEKNLARQEAMKEVEKEAVEQVEKEKLDKNKIIIVSGKWAKGVIGPTASRLVEKLMRPVIIFSEEKDAYVGSARSVKGVDIVELITKVESYVKKYGGHKGAAGLTVTKEKFIQFMTNIIKYAEKISSTLLVKKLVAELEIKPDEVALETAKVLEKLEPFGMGNSKPIFYMGGVGLSEIKTIGKDKNHLSFSVAKDDLSARCVYFNFPQAESFANGKYDVLFYMENNPWNGREYLKLNILGMRKADG